MRSVPVCDIPWQDHDEFRKATLLALDAQLALMLANHDVEADRESESGPLARRFGREEGMKNLVTNGVGNALAVIANANLDPIPAVVARHPDGGEKPVAGRRPFGIGGVAGV